MPIQGNFYPTSSSFPTKTKMKEFARFANGSVLATTGQLV